MRLLEHPIGEYRFLSGIAPYSSGVVACPGYEIIRATLHVPIPYRDGFNLIEAHLAKQQRTWRALCALELRLPAPLSFAGFGAFNQEYQGQLAERGLLMGDLNPVARTNVAPAALAPDEPSLYAFSYTVPCGEKNGQSTFVVAGAGELVGGELSAAAILRPGDRTIDSIQEKAALVMKVMGQRLQGLQVSWSDVTAVDVYTVHSLLPFLEGPGYAEIGQATIHGAHWYYSRPPIIGLEFEMDVRGVRREIRVG
jgi:hypothetical protein